jgi:alkylation response protein AidB-like acyl-CoA dehydrogenase
MTDTLKKKGSVELNDLDDRAFRLVLRDWIAANYPDELRNPPRRLHWSKNKTWYFALARQGWLAPNWPKEHGGMGLSVSKQLIMTEELERHGCARTNDHGITLLGPLLIRFGTEAQKCAFLPKILSGEHIWCQGYSEPGAGSDLASLSTEAIRDDDFWVVNGQKTWTSLGNDANWIFLLVRTNKAVKNQAGISFLLVPMDSLGITVRPISNLELYDEFCEVFFDNVRVPKDNLVGQVDQGWSMAKAVLGFERIYLGSQRQSSYVLTRLYALAKHVGLERDPVFQDRYAQFLLDLADHNDLFEKYAAQLRLGQRLGEDVSLLKVNQSELYGRITEYMLEIAGEEAGLKEPIEGDRELNPSGQFLQARAATIYGGSSEIQRNILAKNVLGLPV